MSEKSAEVIHLNAGIMSVKEALELADKWTMGATFYPGKKDLEVVCAVLSKEVRKLRGEKK